MTNDSIEPGGSGGSATGLGSSVLADDGARHRIATDLATTFFVDAGAGSGKTRALVGRVLALVDEGHDLAGVAAITFTEKAAAELRQRLREQLEQRATASGGGPEADRWRAALDALDSAAIGTLHAFALRLLLEHPIEAGLPPVIQVLDEIASDLAFEVRWVRFFRTELAVDPSVRRALLLGVALGIKEEHLRELAARFDDNWDQVETTIPLDAQADEPPGLDLRELLVQARRLVGACTDVPTDDKLRTAILEHLPGWLDQVERLEAGGDELALVSALQAMPAFPTNVGQKANWEGSPFGSVQAARDATKQVVGTKKVPSVLVNRALDPVRQACLERLAVAIAGFTMRSVDERRRAGELSFHDLLVQARRLLRDTTHGPTVRRRLGRRYTHLLIDEYQDTDPIQLDLALAVVTDPSRAGPPDPGRLFFVGDPKQSIYRFRRADIDQYLATPALVDATPLSLTTNFRSNEPLVGWVNEVFGRLIARVELEESGRQLAVQPDFAALTPHRADPLAGPSVTLLGTEPHEQVPADELRTIDGADVTATIERILREGWQVHVEMPDGSHEPRPARYGDIAVLIPTRLALPMLESALDSAGVPHRTEAGSLIYASREVRDLLLALQAIDDPSDGLAVLSTLRSPLYGCSDVDLYRYRVELGGRLDPEGVTAEQAAASPVGAALADLARRSDERAHRTPAQLLDAFVRDRRVLEAGLATPRARDVWRRVRFVVDQARAWSEAGGVGVRAYLDWARRQARQTGRSTEVVLPETDEEAVRILTVHAAKGLEFPIVIVAGLTTVRRPTPRGVQVRFPKSGGWAVYLGKRLSTALFDATQAVDEQMSDHEQRRLLYVACTRARDHLVVSLHRKAGTSTLATLLVDEGGAMAWPAADQPPSAQAAEAGARPSAAAVAPVDLDAWRAERAAVLARASVTSTTSPTALAVGADEDDERHTVARASPPAVDDEPIDPGLDKPPVNLDLPPWRKGRYGTAIGRAVHGVLQTVDLATGAGIDDAAAAQAAAEGILGLEETVVALARSALDAPAVVEAAGSPHWRELYVGAPVGARLLEGYVDLLYRGPAGLVVVDYKTDVVGPDLEAKVARYRVQAAAYALAVELTVGEPVVACHLVFCDPADPRQVTVESLDEAKQEVRRRLSEPPIDPSTAGRA